MKAEEIKTFEDACKALGIEPGLPEVSALPLKHANAIVANYKLFVIAQALNEGWEPDWSNYSEYKYCPWFDMDSEDEAAVSSGSRFSFYDCGLGRTASHVGSRLVFKSRELARYAGTQFVDLTVRCL